MLQSLVGTTVAQLQNWKDSLPPELQIDLENESDIGLPHVILLQ